MNFFITHKAEIICLLKHIRNIILIVFAVMLIVLVGVLKLLSEIEIPLEKHMVKVEVEVGEIADYTVLIDPDPNGKYWAFLDMNDGVRCQIADYMKANDLVLCEGEQEIYAVEASYETATVGLRFEKK